ncbi:MAG: alginate export family protein [Planctomycetota bacterium]
MLYLVALASLTSLVPAQEPPRPSTPPYAFLRQNEDWSAFEPSGEAGDTFDALKHIDLSSDGHTWISFGGRLESRIESWSGFGFSDANEDTFAVSRALGHADLHVGESFRLFVEGKSAQATDRDLPGGRRTLDLDTIDLQQAFIDVTVPLGDGTLLLRPGRQMLLFGAQRLISPLPWGNTLRTWEGLTAAWRSGPWTVTGIATVFVPVDKTEFNTPDDEQTLWGVYAQRAQPKGGHGLDLYALGNERDAVSVNGTTGNESRLTVGARAFGPAAPRVDYEVELSWQTGEIGANDVAAWSVASQLGWKPDSWAGAPRLYVGFDAASGDDAPGGDVGTFHQLFPLGHAYFGFIDAIGRQNILDASAGAKWSLGTATQLGLGLHALQLLETSDALYNAGGAPTRTGFGSREIGYELDLTIDHKLNRHAQLYGGYSHFFTGSALADSGPSDDVDFLHAGVRYTF